MSNLRRGVLASVLAAAVLLPATALAQQAANWPNRPIRMIVGYPPGGGADSLARLIGQQMSTALDVPEDIFPPDAGLIVADAYGAQIVREADEHRLPGATRRSMMLRFGRMAAQRLHMLVDPGAAVGVEF